MQLPPTLRRAIEKHAQGHSISSLAEAAGRISTAYRSTPQSLPTSGTSPKLPLIAPTASSAPLANDLDRIAYLVTRMPATYASAHAVLVEIRSRMPNLSAESVLDLGAGPGTASWAALDVFPEAASFTLLEKDTAFAALGKSLVAESENSALPTAAWRTTDIAAATSFPPNDLVVLSYSIGEVKQQRVQSLLTAAWNATRKVLAIVEPGTPAGFARISALRDELLLQGGHIVAPCPHANACPMAGDDWCHFAARVERSSIHRRVKGGTLGYEDEKYSYIAVSKTAVQPCEARIIRHPQQRPGFVELRLCRTEGLRDIIASRRHKPEFRRAKNSTWGDAWERDRDGNS